MKSHVRSWNKVIMSLIKARDAWDKHRRVALSRPDLSGLAPEFQKMLGYPINKYAFEHMLQELPSIYTGMGGLESLLLEEPEEETTKTGTTSA